MSTLSLKLHSFPPPQPSISTLDDQFIDEIALFVDRKAPASQNLLEIAEALKKNGMKVVSLDGSATSDSELDLPMANLVKEWKTDAQNILKIAVAGGDGAFNCVVRSFVKEVCVLFRSEMPYHAMETFIS